MVADYSYDVFGNRIEKVVDPDGALGTDPLEVERYAIDGWNPAKPSPVGNENYDVWADLDSLNDLTTRYLRGDKVDELLGRTDGSASYWTLTDHLGSVRDVVDETGALADSLRYDSFGNIDTVTETADAYRGRYTWTSREFDLETQLQFNRARYYDPATGRWISQDPMGFDAGDSNLYRYVNNRSTIATDPSGLLLVAIDGTGMRPYLAAAPKTAPAQGAGRWRSHVKNFFEDDPTPKNQKFFDDRIVSALPQNAAPEVRSSVRAAYKWLEKTWKQGEPIDLVGHSRGGYAVLRLAWVLHEFGIRGQKEIPVRFLGLYDAVPMVVNDGIQLPENEIPGGTSVYLDEYTIVPPNVENTFAIFAAPSSKDGKFVGSRQSGAMNWPRAGFKSPGSDQEYGWEYIKATHSGIGGGPWDGDRPTGHNEKQDIAGSIQTDQAIRKAAQKAGIRIKDIRDYGYKLGGGLVKEVELPNPPPP